MSPQFLPTSYNGGDVSGGCTMYILCEETKCCRNPEKWSAEYYMVKNVWDNLIIYTTPYISYTKYISPWKKAWRGTNRWRVHWCQTRALNEDTRLNIRSEEPAGVRWCEIFFLLGRFLTSWYSLLELFWEVRKKGYLLLRRFLTRWKKWLLQETFASAHTTPRGPHSPHHARQHITCVLIIS